MNRNTRARQIIYGSELESLLAAARRAGGSDPRPTALRARQPALPRRADRSADRQNSVVGTDGYWVWGSRTRPRGILSGRCEDFRASGWRATAPRDTYYPAR